jgi:hypothetical protein
MEGVWGHDNLDKKEEGWEFKEAREMRVCEKENESERKRNGDWENENERIKP